jgi:ribosomal protein S18 acetylase RimI-like enzyme
MAGSDAPPVADAFRTSQPLPDIPGLVFRHVRRPDDYPQMNVIANATRAATGVDFSTTDEQFQSFYEHPGNFVTERDVAVVEVGGRIVGYVRGGVYNQVSGPRVFEIMPFLDPAVAPKPLLPFMLSAIEDHLRELAAAAPPGEKVLETFGGDSTPDRDELIVRAGFEPVRFFYSMVRPHLDDLPDAPLPPGLEIREVQPEHLRAIWDAQNEAFRDHWGWSDPGEEEYQQYLTDPVGSDASLWRVAWDGDEVAGQVRSYIHAEENERHGRLRGHTEFISVRRPWRRRGLARALIAASFPLLRARGMTEAALGVDTENTSGALRLYESCGFLPVNRSAVYRKPLV